MKTSGHTQNVMLMRAWILPAAFHLAVVFGTNTANNQVEHFDTILLLLFYLSYFPSMFCCCQEELKFLQAFKRLKQLKLKSNF